MARAHPEVGARGWRRSPGSRNNPVVSDALIQVAILSPHQIVVEGLGAILGRHRDVMEVVAMPGAVGDDEPVVVLYDVSALAAKDSTDLDRLMRSRSCAVIAVAHNIRPDLLTIALAHGVDASVPVDASEQELVETVALLALHPTEHEPIDGTDPHLLGADVGFTEREGWVVALIAQGLTNAEIAAEGFVSINSVKTYIRSAYRKAGIRSRAQAVSWVLMHGSTHDDAPRIPQRRTST